MTGRAMTILLAAKLLVFTGFLVGALVRHDVFFYVMTWASAMTIILASVSAQSAPKPAPPPDHVTTMPITETFERPDWTDEADR